MTPLESRDVHDGDVIPEHCYGLCGLDAAKLLSWVCPSLTQAEAQRLGALATRLHMSMAAHAMRRFVATHLDAVRYALADESDDALVRLRAMSMLWAQ